MCAIPSRWSASTSARSRNPIPSRRTISEWETYTELETLNSMVPVWKKQKSEVTDEEYANFYKEKFGDYTDPPASSSAAPRHCKL